jgi:DNA-binding response OmpR family regulator
VQYRERKCSLGVSVKVPRNFIILEKDEDIRSLYRRKLEQKFQGCVVIEAASCMEALDSMTQAAVDAVVMNQAALDARGVEMVRTIRRGDAHVPLVAIGDAPHAEAALQNGADLFIETQKWQEIGTAVEQVLGRRGGRLN